MGRVKKAKNKSKGRLQDKPKGKPKGKPKVKLQVKPAVEDQATPTNKPEDKPTPPKTPSPQETRSKRTPYKGVLLPHPGELRFAPPPPPPSPPATSPLAAEPSELGGRPEDTPLHRYQQRHRKRGGIEQSIMIRRRLEDEMRKRQEEERQEEEEENRIRTARVARAAILPLPGPRICRFCGVTFDPRANNACPNHQSKKIVTMSFVYLLSIS
ncbi:hypothetical protein F4813DRAFT_347955 [Daldinia decipiens]|uniref:uncharacterized protein n=1 Tax=Daldinia decipiens TaxID=326647 RepID=UPI0020C26DC2|nr:uncharacterized protein F4813DRAFT_347955 [Daldinia decipiens]KAI1661538.1 hypothetical protein F4813DRAFT_347955 [Daldinia decipiens]